MSRTRVVQVFAGALAGLITSGLAAQAAPLNVGYILQIGQDLPQSPGTSSWIYHYQQLVAADRPMFALTNTSTTASITQFKLTVRDTVYSIGSLNLLPATGSVSVTGSTPGTVAGVHAHAPAAILNFAGFTPGQAYEFRADIDRTADNGQSLTSFRQSLVGGMDPAKWARIDVTFSDGSVLSSTLSPYDPSGQMLVANSPIYRCSALLPGLGQIETKSNPVPEPATLLLAAVGSLGLLAGPICRRRPAA